MRTRLVGAWLGMGIALAVVGGGAAGSLGCGDGKGAKTAVTPKEMPSGEAWPGVYYHPIFGYLHLEESGGSVAGRWMRTDKSQWGEMSGTADGNVLRFTWKEHKYGIVGPSGTTAGSGYFVYGIGSNNIPEVKGKYGVSQDDPESSWDMVKQKGMKADLTSIKGELGGSENPVVQDQWK